VPTDFAKIVRHSQDGILRSRRMTADLARG
jgi:hypothetical protein